MATRIKIISPRGERVSTINGLRAELSGAKEYADALGQLLESREATVELKSGETATVLFADEIAGPEPGTRPSFIPRHDYEAQVVLRFDLAAHIECVASSRAEAGYLIERVLRRKERAPRGFRVILDAGDLEGLARQLDTGDSGTAPQVADFQLTHLRERLLITSKEMRS